MLLSKGCKLVMIGDSITDCGRARPVGEGDGLGGGYVSLVNALISAGQPHTFLGINSEGRSSVVKTTGNPNRHVILRGAARPNYYREDVDEAVRMVNRADPALRRPVMVDSSHGNSARNPARQPVVCRDVVGQFVGGQRALMGLLIESHLQPGSQRWQLGAQLQYGVSITDACLGWEDTESLLDEVAQQIRSAERAA